LDKVLSIAVKYELEVIEDAACALGATYHGKPVGTFGKLGIFSFHPRKSITTGEGGAIVTNDAQLAERCRQWRNHGQQLTAGQRDFVVPGLNYRMTEMQAAIGRVQLSKFEGILQRRRSLVREYLRLLKASRDLRLPADPPEHTWQTFMPVLPEGTSRAAVVERLAAQGIECGAGSVAGHLGKHFQTQEPLGVAEELHDRGLALPLHARMTEEHIKEVAEALRQHLQGTTARQTPGVSTPSTVSRTR
jgi:dTDP-4-amino-4,6-dideoxygalactose transaminase